MSNGTTQTGGKQYGDPNLAKMMGILPAPPQDPPMSNYRGTALHHSFKLRERMKLSREKPMLGMWYGAFPHAGLARVIGQAGFDYVLMDWEHTPMGIEQVCELIKTIQYAGEGSTAVIVRVPSHEHYQIAWLLDAGASGVILPHTETVEQAKAAVRNARFSTLGGTRSGPPNALLWGYNDGGENGGGMMEVWGNAAVIIQIESKVGADNAAEIAAVEGVDGLMVGPGDLALDLNVEMGPAMYQDPNFMSSVSNVVKAAKEHDIACLMPGMNSQATSNHLQLGFTMVMCSNDGIFVSRSLREDINGGYEAVKSWKETQRQTKDGSK